MNKAKLKALGLTVIANLTALYLWSVVRDLKNKP